MPPVSKTLCVEAVLRSRCYASPSEDNSGAETRSTPTGYCRHADRTGRLVLAVEPQGPCVARWLVAISPQSCAAKRLAGIVVDGAVRDVAERNQAGIGIRALALMPMRNGQTRRWSG